TDPNNAFEVSLSGTGRYIAFSSYRSSTYTSLYEQVYVIDRTTGKAQIVSVASDGTEGSGESYSPSISADGHYVAYVSTAANLVPDNASTNTPGIFVHDRTTGQTERVSVASDGTEADGASPPSL